MEEALRARPPLGQRSAPRLRRPPRVGGEGVRGACPPPTWWPSAEPAAEPAGGGGRRRGNAWLLRAAKMQLKTSGSDEGAALPGEMVGWGSRGADNAPVAPVVAEAEAGTGPGPSSPPASGCEKGFATPPPVGSGPTPPGSSRLARLGAWRFAGLGSLGPGAVEGRVPSMLGGAAHRRVAGGPELGRAWEAGRARPNQEDDAAAPARRASGTRTWRPGTTRGGALGQLGPAEEPVRPSWPARQQRLMLQPGLLHRAQDGAPCS